MPPSISATPAGHRRISSLKATTLNFFKGNNKGSQLSHSGSIRRNELTISHPIPQTDANVSPSSPMPLRADTEPSINNRTQYSPTTAFDAGIPRGRSSTTRLDSMVVEEEGGESITVGMDPRELSPQQTRHSEPPENSVCSDKMTATPSARSKTTGNKLKMALSLLRRRSNSNLRKDYEIRNQRGERPRVSSPFNEVNFEYADRRNVEPNRSASSPPSVVLTTATPQKSSGFGFGRGIKTHSRQVLTKPQPSTTRRPRRATVTSGSYDMEHGLERRSGGYTELQPRPASSQGGAVRMEEGPSSDSILNPDNGPSGMSSIGAGAGGGLFPRPNSLQRNWSDGARPNRESGARLHIGERSPGDSSGRASHDPDRLRPLSFGGVLHGYGSMKITEAASLESRVRDLESQVATLQSYISQQNSVPQEQRLFPSMTLHRQPLQSPFDEQKMHKRNFSASTASSSVVPDYADEPQTPKNKAPFNQFEAPETPKPSTPTPSTIKKREEAIRALEGNSSSTLSRRNTSSTIRAVAMVARSKRSSSGSEDGNRSPMPVVSLAQYTGLVTVVKREQRARRKLENQVANLQEQMSLVLHRHLLAQSSMNPLINEANGTGLRPDFNSIRRKTSSEVPTPDLTPPRVSPIESMVPNGNPFSGFDSELITDGSEESLYMGVEPDEHEIWETPGEGSGNNIGIHKWVNEGGYPEGSSAYRNSYRSSQTRTMSLSQLTHKSSLANR
ncbi:hypothetical protein RUND412_009909 [Rhizina undulata]